MSKRPLTPLEAALTPTQLRQMNAELEGVESMGLKPAIHAVNRIDRKYKALAADNLQLSSSASGEPSPSGPTSSTPSGKKSAAPAGHKVNPEQLLELNRLCDEFLRLFPTEQRKKPGA